MDLLSEQSYYTLSSAFYKCLPICLPPTNQEHEEAQRKPLISTRFNALYLLRLRVRVLRTAEAQEPPRRTLALKDFGAGGWGDEA